MEDNAHAQLDNKSSTTVPVAKSQLLSASQPRPSRVVSADAQMDNTKSTMEPDATSHQSAQLVSQDKPWSAVSAPVAKASHRLTTELDAKPFQTALLPNTWTGKDNALAHQDRTRSPLAVDVTSHSTTNKTSTLASEFRPARTESAPAHSARTLSHTEPVVNKASTITTTSTPTHACQDRPTQTESALAQQVRPLFNSVLAARLVFQEAVIQ